MKLHMLIENESNISGLVKEHGISLYIEFMGTKLLFDTGENAKRDYYVNLIFIKENVSTQ